MPAIMAGSGDLGGIVAIGGSGGAALS